MASSTPQPYTDYENSTYTVVSQIAYLLGVPRKIFENEHEPPQLAWYQSLERNTAMRIVRNLCSVRNSLLTNYKRISPELIFELNQTPPEQLPGGLLEQLEADGIRISQQAGTLDEHLIQINRYLLDRINNCKKAFPIWLKWEYLQSLFLMPGGLKPKGLHEAQAEFGKNRPKYPYQMYINWPEKLDDGNILYNDKKFVLLLYRYNRDEFCDLSKVSDAGNLAKDGIYRFLKKSRRTAVVVDCENADPYKLYATLKNLDQSALLNKIVKIILYNDIHAATAWKILNHFTQIPIEHIMVDRVKENKSLVDIRLTTGTCREFFQNHIDSFILVSSDSDYWGLISSMPEAGFFVLVESEKCSPAVKKAMEDAGITYCHMDDFCTGNSDEIKIKAVLTEVQEILNAGIDLRIQPVLEKAYTAARAEMSAEERQQFYEKYIKTMRVVIDGDGAIRFALGKR